jgi:hypothetical protein
MAGLAVLELLQAAGLPQLVAVVVLVLVQLQVALAPCLVSQPGGLLCCCRRLLTLQ